ncbi:MAG: aminopeptidase P family protein [Chloroflexi bacterium]|nr:aminopeptidase P family protein [Chloroflexota bacterium]
MHSEQRQRTARRLAQDGIEQAIFASPLSVRWLTGIDVPGGSAENPALLWYDQDKFTLLVENGFAAQAAIFGAQPGCAVRDYLGYTIQQPIDRPAHLARLLSAVADGGLEDTDVIGIETQSLSMHLWWSVRQLLNGSYDLTPIDGWLEPLRAVKTAEEIATIREGFRLTDIGHVAGRQAVQADAREIDVWTAVQSAVEQAAGQRMTLGNDCIVGHRPTNNIGGPPGDIAIRPDDSFILDLSVIHQGYWTDSCATYYAGEPTAQQVTLHNFVEEALAYAISLVKPGAVAKEIDQKVRDFMDRGGYKVYPHHTGHGIGLTGHEAPRIVPYNDEVLEAGMVIMLEPGIYFPGVTSVRLEDGLLVTETGAEILSGHDKSLP